MTQTHDDQLAIVLGQRQLIAVCCMFLVVMGLVSTLAYVCGRSITAAQMKAQEKTEPAAAIFVDPVRPMALERAKASGPMTAQAETLPVRPKPATIPPVVRPATAATEEEPAEPAQGETYWQVGVVDRGIAAVFVEYLTKHGFRARTASAQSGSLRRVLVGPVTNPADAESTKRNLDAGGFQSFMKRY
jgi:cell division septation protein DedD